MRNPNLIPDYPQLIPFVLPVDKTKKVLIPIEYEAELYLNPEWRNSVSYRHGHAINAPSPGNTGGKVA